MAPDTKAGRKESVQAGTQEGMQAGMKAESQEGRQAGRKAGRQAGRTAQVRSFRLLIVFFVFFGSSGKPNE